MTDNPTMLTLHIILIACASFLSLIVVGACLYCFRFRSKNEIETRQDEEKHHINKSGSVDSSSSRTPETESGSLWGKLNTWFSRPDSKQIVRQNAPRNGSTGTSLYDKPPMGTMSFSLVQPAQRKMSLNAPSTSEDKTITGGRSRFTSSSYIPEGFKLPFELSFDTGEDPPTEYLGKLEYSVMYIFAESTLCVKVIKAVDLPAMDLSGTSDPFVKCCLLPDRKRKLETKIRRKTLNPVWNECLSFEGLTYEKIKQRVLYLQVLDYDRFSRNDPIGEIYLPLHTINLGDEATIDQLLSPCKGSNKRGELLLSLCYQPIEGILDVGIIKGRNMKPMDLNGTSDPYVKIWLLYRGKRLEKRKTAIIKNTLNPKFSEEFTLQAPMGRLRDLQLEITVMDYDAIGRNDTIGKIYLGHKSSGLEKQHWKDMLSNARKPVSQWHVLKV